MSKSLKREDVANVEQETMKNSMEVFQRLRNSRGLYKSYLYRYAKLNEILVYWCDDIYVNTIIENIEENSAFYFSELHWS